MDCGHKPKAQYLVQSAISILLSFKMSQSYDRWWEARKVWGAIVNDSRSLTIQLQSFLNEKNTIRKIAFRQIAWCYSLGQSLRGLNPLEKLDHYFDPGDFDNLLDHLNKPLAILQQNAREIKALKFNNQIEIFTQIQLDNTFTRLCDAMGRAERIKTTIFPQTYRLFLHFEFYLFVAILSIALDDVKILFLLPLIMVISLVFFLMEKTATYMQDPFSNTPSDTAVTAIATTIEINIKQLLGEKEIPEPLQSDTFYIL